ncbi:MAG TPA: cytochrome c [Gemmatimonadaceae bacterium]
MNRVARVPLAALVGIVFTAGCRQVGDNGAEVHAAPPPQLPSHFDLGSAVDSVKLASIDIDIDPTGAHLPPGSGTPAKGFLVYTANCARCHGAKGEGIPTMTPAGPKLVGRDPRDGFPFGNDPKLVKTVGNYWPYATTLYDYIHRAMPLSAPGTLKPDDVYAVVAYLLSENEIIDKNAVIDAKTLPAVKMPAVGHFVVDDRRGKTVR